MNTSWAAKVSVHRLKRWRKTVRVHCWMFRVFPCLKGLCNPPLELFGGNKCGPPLGINFGNLERFCWLSKNKVVNFRYPIGWKATRELFKRGSVDFVRIRLWILDIPLAGRTQLASCSVDFVRIRLWIFDIPLAGSTQLTSCSREVLLTS